ncbi:MAG: chemotaxis protein CheW [Syntrophobacteraceae bacterium]
MIESLMETFRVEAAELLSELETALLDLETAQENETAMKKVFRCLHTIKGSGAMAGFDDIASFAHELENVFEIVRQENIPSSREFADRILSAIDSINSMLEAPNSAESKGRAEEIISSLKSLLASGTVPASDGTLPQGSSPGRGAPIPTGGEDDSGKPVAYRILFRPNPDIFSRGTNPALLLKELRDLGQCLITACLDDIPDLRDLDPEECHTYWNIILTTAAGENAVRDVFIFIEDDCELKIEAIGEKAALEEMAPKKLGEMLVEQGELTSAQLAEVLSKQKRLGEMLTEEGLVSPGKVQAALMEQSHLQEIREKRSEQKDQSLASVRVPAAKLDSLVDLVGELVTVQAGLTQLASTKKFRELRSIAEQVNRLTSELRDNAMSLRMLPIGVVFSKFNRLIRDLSMELGKEAVLTTEGAEVELDKTVIERLRDPLVHMIRNSVDHGLESPEVRLAAGKPAQGTVHLSAQHSGAHVLVKIRDDGAGLDPNAILAKAIDKGLVQPNAALSEREIFSLIFAPGFSTAQKVTNVSGRGVGMDVVKGAIDSLGGSIEIHSKKGAGTTFTLELPLTLAIIDGLLVKVGDAHFVLPLSFVEECVELQKRDKGTKDGRQLAFIRQKIVPYLRLRDRFSIPGAPPPIEQIVITETLDGKVGIVVDKVVGQHQTVIKNLTKIYRNVTGISGTTILGDGTVALIVDIPKMINSFAQEEISAEEAVQ